MIKCPQCGAENKDEAKNCQRCRVNLYWAVHHYAELACLRQSSQLPPRSETAAFLLATSKRVDTGPVAAWLRNFIGKTTLHKRVEEQETTAGEEIEGRAGPDF